MKTNENENTNFPVRLLVAIFIILVGIVLILSCLYNGFWTGEYAKATFHGLIGFVLINIALSLD